MQKNVTQDQILELAQTLVQQRGFNAMSYRDLASVIDIKTSSIHYYFPSKEDLGLALIRRYRDLFHSALVQIELANANVKLQLEQFVDLFISTVRTDRICLGGMFASDFETLPDSMKIQVRDFYKESEAWLANILKKGRDQGQLNFTGAPRIKAETIFSALEGIMISARLFADEKRLIAASEWIQQSLSK